MEIEHIIEVHNDPAIVSRRSILAVNGLPAVVWINKFKVKKVIKHFCDPGQEIERKLISSNRIVANVGEQVLGIPVIDHRV